MKHFFIILSLLFVKPLILADIHVFGDSHGFFCFNNTLSNITADENSFYIYNHNGLKLKIPFHIHWLESRTMYRVGRDGLNGLNVKNYGVKNNDLLIFQFGEVDVRCHIGKQRDLQKRNIDEVIGTLVNNFINVIVLNRAQFNNLLCIVISVMPPSDNGFNPVYPYYGLLAERVGITQQLNQCLKQTCSKNKIYFFDAYELLSAQDGSLNMEMSDGIVHVHPRNNYKIKDLLIKNLITEKILI